MVGVGFFVGEYYDTTMYMGSAKGRNISERVDLLRCLLESILEEGIYTLLEWAAKSLPRHFNVTHWAEIRFPDNCLVLQRAAKCPPTEYVPLVDFCGALQGD